MPLATGVRFGPYEILAPLGAGGMGEVYKARDTRLDRTVAVKVLPSHIAAREDLRARFEREARAVSSLNHPHICTLHDVGREGDIDYMVMEHLEGETLFDRLQKGPLPLDQALKYAQQIADAVDRAHRSGVVHRDLKPGNIMLTRDGAKVLDFGLAKSAPKAAPDGATLTAAITTEGTILGTPQYMSPEQIEGREADARSDIFAFGCVLYEMVTGKRAFDGKTKGSVIGAILSADPPAMSSLQPVTPPALEHVVRRCLVKDPDERSQSLWDVLLDLRSIGASSLDPSHRPANGNRLIWPAAAAVSLAAAVVFAVLWMRRPPQDMHPLRFTIEAPPGAVGIRGAHSAISPDGRMAVFFVEGNKIRPRLWLRPLHSLEAKELPRTEGAALPFWSPDGRSLAFFANGKLKRLDLAGGAPLDLCETQAFGGTWSHEGVILFGSANGISRVAASGGTPVPVTAIDSGALEIAHLNPQFLPDGRRFLFYVRSRNANLSGTYAASLDRGSKVKVQTSDGRAIYAPEGTGSYGHLLWLRDQTLMAQRFNHDRLHLEGDPAPVADGIEIATFRGAFSASSNGVLLYRTGANLRKTRLTWISRDGKRETLGAEDDLTSVRISPDGKRAAVTRLQGGNSDVWVYEFARRTFTRLTFEPTREIGLAWSPDGREVAFTSERDGLSKLYKKDAMGGSEELLADSGVGAVISDWSPDGRYLLFQSRSQKTGVDLLGMALDSDRKPFPIIQGPRANLEGQFSPDGRWIVFVATDSGPAVNVRPFSGRGPAGLGKWQISTGAATHPRWSPDGREIYYQSRGAIYAAAVRLGATAVEPDTPRELFKTASEQPSGLYTYDIAPDGKRFLVLEPVDAGDRPDPLTVMVNWQAALKP